ncbi:MAG: T9SS type A sorting domain-containing protein [Saprospiraceae bacterium]|nr:T9SS type A sorting domain-containing protein [Saprospiraceae bacterium]
MKVLSILIAFVSIVDNISTQCSFVVMADSNSELFSQLLYTEETLSGFKTYMRKYFYNSDLDDPRNGIYLQERDECMNLLNEEIFLRVIDLQEGVFHPMDYLFIIPALNKEYLWITSGSTCLYFNINNNTYIINRFEYSFDLSSFNLIEALDNQIVITSGGIVTVMDSLFHVRNKYRSVVFPTMNLDSSKFFFGFKPYSLPLFANDSLLLLLDISGNTKWSFEYSKNIPYLHDWDYSSVNYYIIGSEDPDGNKVAYNPVIYKFDKDGQLISKKFIETNIFKASIGTRCLFADECLYVSGWQTVSRRPRELKQTFIAKLDLDLNVIWKRDLDFGCGPIKNTCKSIMKTKDGGALFTFQRDNYGDTCNPSLIKVDPNGNITSLMDSDNSNLLTVYPNPTKGIVILKGLDQPKLKDLELVDAFGNNYPIRLIDNKFDITMVPSGIYFLKIQLRNQYILTKKLIKL